MLLSLPAAALLAAAAPADTARVVFVATTDVHGRVTAWDETGTRAYAGGLTRVATVVDSLRRQYPGQVVVADAGDLIQGNAFAAYFAREPRATHPVIDAMNAVGYDVATLGNHEFNFGVAFLERAFRGAAYPVVSANVMRADGTPMYLPSAVLRRGPVRVGVTGFTTPGVMVWDGDSVRGRVVVRRIAETAPAALRSLRETSDLRIVLIHSGMEGASSYDTTGVGPEDDAATLAAMPDAPDLVLVGHSHREMRDSVLGRTHFVQPRFHAQSVTVTHLLLVPEGGGWRLARVEADLVPLAPVPPHPGMETRFAEPRQAVGQWLGATVASTLGPMDATTARAEPTPLIGFINAVQRARTGAQLSAAAAFRTEAGLPHGDVRRADFSAIYPYENTLRALRITGAQLRAFLEHSTRYYRLDAGGRAAIDPQVPGYNYDMVAGATYTIDLRRPVGSRIVDLAVGGRRVRPGDTFTLAVNSYRAAGGGGYDMLRGAPVVHDRGENVRDLLLAAAESLEVIDPARYAEPNWRWATPEQAAQVRALFAKVELRDANPSWQPVAVPDGPAAAGPRRDTLRVLAINDFHGALLPRTYPWSRGRPIGGAAALAAHLDSAEARCACPTIRLDAGDEMQGTLESNLVYGQSTVEAFNRMRIAAAAVGNHDFDWSADTLRARMTAARYRWLAANVFDSTTGRRPSWLPSHAVLDVQGLKVGVVGYITRLTKSIVKAEHVRGLVFGAHADAIRDVLDSVKAQRPDVTILLAHEGGFCDSLACTGEIFELAGELRPGEVDLIVSGHTHARLATTAGPGIPVVQARSSGTAYGIVDLVRRAGGGWDAKVRVETTYADSVVTPDRAMTVMVDEVRRRTDPLARRVIGRLRAPLGKASEDGEYPLGNFIADAQRSVARADVAIMNNGGIRAGLPAGVISYEQLFWLQPFANNVVTLELTGRELVEVLEHVVAGDEPSAHVAGATFRYDSRRPAGQRVRDVRIGATRTRPLEPGRRYRVAVNDYMAGGGSGFTMLAGRPAQPTGLTDLEALERYFARLPQPVEPPATGRIRKVP